MSRIVYENSKPLIQYQHHIRVKVEDISMDSSEPLYSGTLWFDISHNASHTESIRLATVTSKYATGCRHELLGHFHMIENAVKLLQTELSELCAP